MRGLVLVLLAWAVASGQGPPAVRWTRYFNTDSLNMNREIADGMCAGSSGGVVMVGSLEAGASSFGFVVNVDQQGDTVGSRVYGSGLEVVRGIVEVSGGYAACVRAVWARSGVALAAVARPDLFFGAV